MRVLVALLILVWTAAAMQADAAVPGQTPGQAIGQITVGTAFFTGMDGAAVTAAHVVDGCARVQVSSPLLPPAEAVLLARDGRSDLALLLVQGARVPGVIGVEPGRWGGPAGLRVLGYGAGLGAALQEAQPRILTGRVRVPSADPRFRIWVQDERIAHGWSGAPMMLHGRLAGVLLELLPDPAETRRVFGRAERGVAAGTDDAAVAALLDRAGRWADAPFGPARDAVVRVYCWR